MMRRVLAVMGFLGVFGIFQSITEPSRWPLAKTRPSGEKANVLEGPW